MLERRLTRLENRLRLPPDDRHVCVGVLKKCEHVQVLGTRIRSEVAALRLDTTGRQIEATTDDIKPTVVQSSLKLMFGNQGDSKERKVILPEVRDDTNVISKGKTKWKGRDGESVTVEALALEHYQNLGYKG